MTIQAQERDNFGRYTLLAALIVVLPVLIILKIVTLQLNPTLVKKLNEQNEMYKGYWVRVQPARGLIYDRYGETLAANKLVYEVGVDLKEVKNPETIAQTVNKILGVDYAKALGLASMQPSENLVHVVIQDNVPPEKVILLTSIKQELRKKYGNPDDRSIPNLSGLSFQPHLARTYPEKSLASNIIGYSTFDGRGVFGVEEKYSQQLGGTPQHVWMANNPYLAEELPKVPDGDSLVLTIDSAIQAAMEELVDKTETSSGAKSVTIVVMDPRNGEVLAMATSPRLDINEYWRSLEVFPKETPFNRAISQAYEPGSVFKVLTMAIALDTGAVTPETKFIDKGHINVGGLDIFNWNRAAHGPVTMQQCMQYSLNVCLAWVATQIGAKNFYSYLQSFGIGHLTGIDLAGEISGRLKIPGDSDWYPYDLGTNSFGQGVSATPLQMASAVSAIANGGQLMAPHVVRSIIVGGRQHDFEPRIASTPIKAETARILTEMLAKSLEVESSRALVENYRVAGKTGTAEIPTPHGYTSAETNASFVGWGPVDDPRFVVYIWLERPKTSIWGSEVAAPVFRQAVEKLVVLMNIPPDDVRKELYGH